MEILPLPLSGHTSLPDRGRIIVNGCRLDENAFREEADRNLVDLSKTGVFSKKEQAAYWQRKWLKEHISLVLLWIVLFAVFCICVSLKNVFSLSL